MCSLALLKTEIPPSLYVRGKNNVTLFLVLMVAVVAFPLCMDMRPCKIWATYGGRCVEKFYPPNQNILTHKPRLKKIVSVLAFQWCKSFGMVIFLIFTAKNGFVLGNGVKGAILGGSETALSKFRH